MELHYSREMAAVKAELDEERARYIALEAKFEELKRKQSVTAAELSKIKFDANAKKGGSSGGVGGSSDKLESAKPSWMAKLPARKPSAGTTPLAPMRDNIKAPLPVATDSLDVSNDAEGSNYRLSMMLQLKTSDGGPSSGGAAADKRKTGFFFRAEDLGNEGVDYLQEQVTLLFDNRPINEDASTIINEMLLGDAGRRTFTFVLKERLRILNFTKVLLDVGPFLTLLSLVNSALTGMQLDNQVDFIAMTFLLGASRAIYTTGSKSQMEEYLADHLRDHSIWNDVRFWEQHFWDVVGKAFKKKFARLSIGKAQQTGWGDEQLKFLSQFTASFAHEMCRWSLPEEAAKNFFDLVFERLVLPAK